MEPQENFRSTREPASRDRPGIRAGSQPRAGPGGRPGRQVRAPPVDVFDAGKNIVLEFEMPGVRKDQVELIGKRRGIAVNATSGPRKEEHPLLMAERGEVQYRREVPLGLEIRADEAEARFQNGVLILEVPKKNPKEGAKRIEIKE